METLTHTERERLRNYLAATHNQVLEATQPLSSTQLEFKESTERWSISEIVEHLTIAHNLILNHIEKIILLPPTSAESAWKGRDEELLAKIRNRENPLIVPEIGNPKRNVQREQLFLQFATIRDRLVRFGDTTTAPLRNSCFPHPTFGQKDGYQWLLGTGTHCERHLPQVREVMSADAFPNSLMVEVVNG